MDTPHVQVILDQNTVPAPLQTALHRVKARVSLRSMDKALTSGISPTADVCVILPQKRATPDVLDRILADACDRACATMVLPTAGDSPARPSQLEETGRFVEGAHAESGALNADELTGRIKALCEVRSPLRQMRAELDHLRQREAERRQGSHLLDEQLRLASEIQRDLLPGPLPDTDPLVIDALYLPADFVSGDIYDVSRLDEHHVGVSLADATGQGLPAALLTIFIKNTFRGKEITGDSYRILQPDEILTRLNAEIMNARLSHCQFVTGLHAVFDQRSGQIRWARGGIPYPVLVHPNRPPRRLVSTGTFIGAFERPQFEVATHTFEADDTMLFFTDGMESMLHRFDPAFVAGDLEQSHWLRRLTDDGIAEAMEEIRRWAEPTPDAPERRDDLTLLALRMSE